MKKITKLEWFALLVVLAGFVFSFFFYPLMPARMVTHWGASGVPDGYLAKFWGLLFSPLLSLLLWIALIIIPRIDPLRAGIDSFRRFFDRFLVFLFLFLFYLQILTIVWNSGYEFNMITYLIPAIATLFWQVGTLLGHAERNWSIGIRTPWTLSNEEVWRRTHRLGARLFHWSALISVVGWWQPDQAIWWSVLPVLVSSLGLTVYSYVIWAKLQVKN